MVQIIQAGPSEATLRQQALNEALGTAIQGFAAYDQQKKQEAATLRQQALADQQMNLQLAQMGIDATAQDLRDYQAGTYKPKVIEAGKEAVPAQYKDLQGPVQPGKQLGKIETAPAQAAVPPVYGNANPMLNYTAAKKAQMEAERAKAKREEEAQNADIAYKKAQTGAMEAEAPLKAQKMQAEIAKIQNDSALSPYTKRKLIAEAQKAEAEAGKLTREASGTGMASAKLAKMSGDTQGKVAAIASGFKAIQELNDATKKGFGPKRIDSNTPLIGTFVSDDAISSNQRILGEVIGRIQSGGAIGVEEEKRFLAMGPRPGDTKEQAQKKLNDQKSFLLNKLKAFGLQESDLAEIGFDVGTTPQRSIGNGESQAIMKQVQSMSRADKIKLLQGEG